MRSSVLSLSVLIAFITSNAFAADKIYSPNVVKGELEMEYSGSATFDHRHDKNHVQEHELEMEYGFTDRFSLELNGELEKEPGHALKTSSLGIGGRFQFFEQGENWIDSGLLVSYGRALNRAEADTLEAKLLLEKQTGPFLHRANIGIEQAVGPHSASAPERVLGFNTRYRYSQYVQPGVEIQSDFGKSSEHKHFNQQEHVAGPALYGELAPHVKYEAAYLVGISDEAAHNTARLLLEYEAAF